MYDVSVHVVEKCGWESFGGWMGCIVKRTNYHLGKRLHSLADRYLVSTRILLIRTSPPRSRFSLVEIARLGGPELTLIASELKPTGGGSENKE